MAKYSTSRTRVEQHTYSEYRLGKRHDWDLLIKNRILKHLRKEAFVLSDRFKNATTRQERKNIKYRFKAITRIIDTIESGQMSYEEYMDYEKERQKKLREREASSVGKAKVEKR